MPIPYRTDSLVVLSNARLVSIQQLIACLSASALSYTLVATMFFKQPQNVAARQAGFIVPSATPQKRKRPTNNGWGTFPGFANSPIAAIPGLYKSSTQLVT